MSLLSSGKDARWARHSLHSSFYRDICRMKLTKNYQRLAIFDTRVNFQDEPSPRAKLFGKIEKTFWIGKIQYRIFATLLSSDPDIYTIGFGIVNFKMTDDELAEFLTQSLGYSVPPERAWDYIWRLDRYGIVGTGQSAAVLSVMLQFVREIIQKYDPSGLEFTVAEPSRKKLYDRMFRSLSPGADIEIQEGEKGGWVYRVWLKARKESDVAN
jgi:hypothetical protein